MSSTIREQKPHAVCMPWPGQGHIHATLKLAMLLHSKGFHITFVHTEFNYNRLLGTGGGGGGLTTLDDFRFETIPDGLPPIDPNMSQAVDSLCMAVRQKFAPPFRALLHRLNEPSSEVPPVSCIVSDSCASFTFDVADEFGIPCVLFSSVSAASYMGFIQWKEVVDRGLMPLICGDDLSDGRLDAPIDWIQGMKDIQLKHLPHFRKGDPNNVVFNFAKDEAQQATRASAILINTFDVLEEEVLNAMSAFLPSIYTVGPLTMLCRRHLDSSVRAVGSNSLWKEDSSCLQWLDTKAPESVIYVNFGSLAVVTKEQLLEFAWGLADSGHAFLWVIRSDVVEGDSAVLPREFLDGIDGRGMLTSWCPQEEVLMHPSVGGFLTHCGWNSTMESISAGVPMLCWPYFGDQPTNCWYLCKLGIGRELGHSVRRDTVEGMIRELMGGDEGKEMRRKALEWREAAVRATERGGRSYMNLDRIIKEVILGGKK